MEDQLAEEHNADPVVKHPKGSVPRSARNGMQFVALALVCTRLLHAQVAHPLEFDAASIKPLKEPRNVTYFRNNPGRFLISNYTVSGMILFAYQTDQQQLTSLPDWAFRERFDINATFEPEAGLSKSQDFEHALERLQSLLRTRFNLQFHREVKLLPAYVLSVDKSGSKLKPSASSEEGSLTSGADGHFVCQARDLDDLADFLFRFLRRRVVNETGLQGLYDFRLDFQIEQGLDAAPEPASTAQSTGASQALPTLTSALRSQLGLKLISKPRPLEVFVIDHIERPTPN